MLIEQLKNYAPYNEQEKKDKEIMLKYLKDFDNAFTRDNEYGHFTASSWIVNKARTKVLMIYHNIYQSWAWTGGHADGETDLLKTAIKEAKEETGIKTLTPLMKDIFSIEIITVNGHVKKGNYVSSHVHLNVTYLLEADETEELTVKIDENSGVKWIKTSDVAKVSTEEWLVQNVYNKLNEKLQMFNSTNRG